jgi:hypothetical protein
MKIKQVRIPDEGEVWKNVANYYIYYGGNFYFIPPLEIGLTPFGVKEYMRTFAEPTPVNVTRSVEDGVNGWEFVHSDWRDFVYNMVRDRLATLKSDLLNAEETLRVFKEKLCLNKPS